MSREEPPRLVVRFIERSCKPQLVEGILGDLFEKFDDRRNRKRLLAAKLLFIWQALGFLRLRFRKKSKTSNTEAMFKNYLLSARRSLLKHPFYAILNTLGLAIGMACGFLILQYVHFELSYDSFFENKENIYRVRTDRYNKGELTTQWAAGAHAAGLHMKEDFPEVLDYVVMTRSYVNVSYENEYIEVDFPCYASANFFEVFSLPLIRGLDSTVLKEPYTAVVSESMARKIFGDKDPIGEFIQQNDSRNMRITGIFQDFPENSHMDFDILFSYSTYLALVGEEAQNNWFHDGFLNYIVLQPGTDPQELERKFPDFVQAREGEELAEYDEGMNFVLQPLDKIHLISNYRAEIKPTGDGQSTYFLLIIGLFVLVIAWINYINLTTARAMARAKEVGIRKVMGSHRGQLIGQFLFESALINLIAFLLATAIVIAAFPFFNDFVERNNSYYWPANGTFWMGWAALIIVGIIVSGFYPALVMSRFKPIAVLRGKFSGSRSGNLLRKALVIFQFLASITLITFTFAVYQQMDYLRSQDLGVKIDQTLVVMTPGYSSDSVFAIHNRTFLNELASQSFVEAVSASSETPGRSPGWNAGGIRLITQPESAGNQYQIIGCDDQFIDFYGLEMVEGRKFDRSFGNETDNVIVTETAAQRLGFVDLAESINKKIYFWGDTFNIVGVLRDYRQQSPKVAYSGLVFRYFRQASGRYSVAISTSNMKDALRTVQQKYEATFDNHPFNYYFLDDFYNEQYRTELRFGTIFGLFAVLAILVACLGLFGLSSFTTTLRTKEIGVRKVLGATIHKLWILLTSDFVRLVLVATLISVPLTWWLLSRWLEDFANRIHLAWWLFVLPAMVLTVLAVAVVSYHTIRTAFLNPASTLKDE